MMVVVCSLLPNTDITTNFRGSIAAISLSGSPHCLQEMSARRVVRCTAAIMNEEYCWPHCYEWYIKQQLKDKHISSTCLLLVFPYIAQAKIKTFLAPRTGHLFLLTVSSAASLAQCSLAQKIKISNTKAPTEQEELSALRAVAFACWMTIAEWPCQHRLLSVTGWWGHMGQLQGFLSLLNKAVMH